MANELTALLDNASETGKLLVEGLPQLADDPELLREFAESLSQVVAGDPDLKQKLQEATVKDFTEVLNKFQVADPAQADTAEDERLAKEVDDVVEQAMAFADKTEADFLEAASVFDPLIETNDNLVSLFPQDIREKLAVTVKEADGTKELVAAINAASAEAQEADQPKKPGGKKPKDFI